MGNFGTFYKGEKKKLKRTDLEKKAKNNAGRSSFVLPQVEIIKKGKDEA